MCELNTSRTIEPKDQLGSEHANARGNKTVEEVTA